MLPDSILGSELEESIPVPTHVWMPFAFPSVCCCPAETLDFLQTQMKDNTEHIRVALLQHLKTIVATEDCK